MFYSTKSFNNNVNSLTSFTTKNGIEGISINLPVVTGKKTEWLKCVSFNKDVIAYFNDTANTKVLTQVFGDLSTEVYTSKDGEAKAKLVLLVNKAVAC